jgi:uncharacterized protein YkwD
MAHCVVCGENDGLLGSCNYCGATVCTEHRLPESHNCISLSGHNEGDLFDGLVDDNSNDRDRSSNPAGGVDVPKPELGSEDGGSRVDCVDEADESDSDTPDTESIGHEPDFSDARGPDVAADGSIKGETAESVSGPQRVTESDSGFSRRQLLGGIVSLGLLGGGAAIATGQVDVPNTAVGDDVSDAVASVANSSTESSASSETTTDTDSGTLFGDGWSHEAARQAIHEAVNAEREQQSFNTLTWDKELAAIAQQYAERMAEEDFFSHESPDGETFDDRYQEAGYECRVDVSGNEYLTGGENIAYTFFQEEIRRDDGSTVFYDTPTELGQGVVKQWMQSPGHRENILTEPWQNEGIGVAMTEDEKVYVVQNFC